MGAINLSLQTITSGSMFRPGEYVWFGQPNQIPDPDNPATLKNPYIDPELTTTANAIQGIDSDSKCEQSTDGRLYGSGTYSIRVMSKADNTGVQRYYLPEVDLTMSASEVLSAIRELAVGTVSESGGVVTGDIIERGSNANGEYVKYADGTLICTSPILGPYTTSNGPVGPLYYAVASWTFPAAFSSIPRVSPASPYDVTAGYFSFPASGAGAGSITETSVTFTLVGTSASGECFGSAVATGRWY